MKYLLFFFVCYFLCTCVVSGQTISTLDTSKYSIELPGYWKPGNKIWRILSDKLPLVSPELKDKELCGDDCNPKYRILFEISNPILFDHYPSHISTDKHKESWEFTTYYGFSSTLLLINEKHEVLTRFILVDTNEVWQIKHRATLTAFTPPPPQKLTLLTSPYNQAALASREAQLGRVEGGYTGETPYSYILKNKDKLGPAPRDLLSIVDNKISSW